MAALGQDESAGNRPGFNPNNQLLVEGKVPPIVNQNCAFFRVWCVVELHAALQYKKPVVLLAGSLADPGGGDSGTFQPNADMFKALSLVIDVSRAKASVDADWVRELERIEQSDGGVTAVNNLCRSACAAAPFCLFDQKLLHAALGNIAQLEAADVKHKTNSFIRAAAGGFDAVLARVYPPKEAAVVELVESKRGDITVGELALDQAITAGQLRTPFVSPEPITHRRPTSARDKPLICSAAYLSRPPSLACCLRARCVQFAGHAVRREARRSGASSAHRGHDQR